MADRQRLACASDMKGMRKYTLLVLARKCSTVFSDPTPPKNLDFLKQCKRRFLIPFGLRTQNKLSSTYPCQEIIDLQRRHDRQWLNLTIHKVYYGLSFWQRGSPFPAIHQWSKRFYLLESSLRFTKIKSGNALGRNMPRKTILMTLIMNQIVSSAIFRQITFRATSWKFWARDHLMSHLTAINSTLKIGLLFQRLVRVCSVESALFFLPVFKFSTGVTYIIFITNITQKINQIFGGTTEFSR